MIEIDEFDCENCGQPLSTTPGRSVVCGNCSMTYVVCGCIVNTKNMVYIKALKCYYFLCNPCFDALKTLPDVEYDVL